MDKTFRKMITKEEIDSFAELSQDRNPLHTDESFAAKTKFGSRIAHGALLIANLIGKTNAKISNLEINYLLPAFLGEEVEFSINKIPLKKDAREFRFEIRNSKNEIIAKGCFFA